MTNLNNINPDPNPNSDSAIQTSKFWKTYFPYLFVGCMLTANYITGVKFVQWGIPYLGADVCNVSSSNLNILMAVMAINACVIGIFSGRFFDKIKLKFRLRLIILLVSFGIQGLIVVFGFFISTELQFGIWIIIFSIVLGFLLCQPFVFVFMLIPSKHRGLMAGIITGLSYLIGNLSPAPWTYSGLSVETAIVTIPFILLVGLGILFPDNTNQLDYNEEKDISHEGPYSKDYSFVLVILLMFGVYFVDSFGFLRISKEPFFDDIWKGSLGVKSVLGIVHLISAVIMGYFYQKLKKKGPLVVFIISLAVFVIGDLLFSLYPSRTVLIITSYLYCIGVSVYTINTFIIWADSSTKKNISSRAGIGIGIGGWLSSFLSTAITEELLVILPETEGYSIQLTISAIIAFIFLILALFYYFSKNNHERSKIKKRHNKKLCSF